MQLKNWNDTRYLLALRRGGTLSAAGQLLGVDDTTVSRRLAVLQGLSAAPLFHRQSDGSMQLSDIGEAVATHAELIEHQVEQINEVIGSEQQSCAGGVRVTSVPMVVNQILAPNVGPLVERHPHLQLELIPDGRDLSLTSREADLAIRLARPVTGGRQVKIRKLGELSCSVYALRKFSPARASKLPWIIFSDELSHIAPQRWMKKMAASNKNAVLGLRVYDVETALQAALAGLGRTVLPDAIAANDNRLRRATTRGFEPPARELWLLSHSSQSGLRRMNEVTNWINEVFAAAL